MDESTTVVRLNAGASRGDAPPQPFQSRAQTNLQLYRQLLDAGYAMDDVRAVREAYVLATTLFAGQLRPEGRPFTCHLVGVASILATVGAPERTIIGGLLHSAYTHGDFGRGRGEVTGEARASLRRAIGVQAEELVSCYACHPWNASTVRHWLANAANLSADVRTVAVIRLADAIEDELDDGLALSSKSSNGNRRIPVADLAALGDALGHPHLGATLSRLLDAEPGEARLGSLQHPHAGSYFACPSSWRERLGPRLLRWTRHVRGAR
jgi:hypothetical protein